MWTRFTERARKACLFAQTEALNLEENYVSTAHLLLGVLKDPSEQLKSLFFRFEKSIDDVRAEAIKYMSRSVPLRKGSSDLALTPRAKCTIDFAYDEVRQTQNNYLHDYHLFLGLLREDDGLAAQVLKKVGFDLRESREFLSVCATLNSEINDDLSEESTKSENDDKIQTLKILKLSSIEAISKVFDDLVSELTKKS